MSDDPFLVLDGDEQVALIQNDVLVALSWLPDACFDFVLTDVPYGLGNHEPTPEEILAYLQGATLNTGGDFMISKWSIPPIAVWKEIHRVAKPGCHVFSYASPKTLDLISMGMRMAGLESRNVLQDNRSECRLVPIVEVQANVNNVRMIVLDLENGNL